MVVRFVVRVPLAVCSPRDGSATRGLTRTLLAKDRQALTAPSGRIVPASGTTSTPVVALPIQANGGRRATCDLTLVRGSPLGAGDMVKLLRSAWVEVSRARAPAR